MVSLKLTQKTAWTVQNHYFFQPPRKHTCVFLAFIVWSKYSNALFYNRLSLLGILIVANLLKIFFHQICKTSTFWHNLDQQFSLGDFFFVFFSVFYIPVVVLGLGLLLARNPLIMRLVLTIQEVRGFAKQKKTKEIFSFAWLYLKIKICEFWLILLD